jgi:hypothetical protein
MRLINYSKVRRSAQADLKRYERLGVKMFTEALKLQSKPNPSPLPMQKAYIDFYTVVFVESATKEFNRIRQDNREKAFVPDDFFLNTWKEWIKDWVLQNLSQLIFDVNTNTDNKIKQIIAEGLEAGLNPFQIERLLLEQIPDPKRARAIARTESTRAFNEGKKKSAQDWANQTGTNLWKIWIHGGAKEPRFQHIQAQNKPIPANSFFEFTSPKVGIVQMDKPGDINGGAAQTVNCSCVVVYVSERYARRNFPDAFVGGVAPRPVTPIAPQPIAVSVAQTPLNVPSAGPFRYANTLKEAKEIAKQIIIQQTKLKVIKTQFSSELSLNQLNRYNEQLNKLTTEYKLSDYLTDNQIKLRYRSSGSSYGYITRTQTSLVEVNFGHQTDLDERLIERVSKDIYGFTRYAGKSKVDRDKVDLATLTHEFGHVIAVKNKLMMARHPELANFWLEMDIIKQFYLKDINDPNKIASVFLGDYASSNDNEFLAEAFTEYKLSSNPSKYALEVGRLIDRYFKR